MFWKNLPYWLKGGIIGALFPPVVFIIDLLLDKVIGTPGEGAFFFALISSPLIPVFNAFLSPSIPYNVTYIIFFLASCTMYFIIGSIFGWLMVKKK